MISSFIYTQTFQKIREILDIFVDDLWDIPENRELHNSKDELREKVFKDITNEFKREEF